MKKIFLTSGVVLCMVCPAFATGVNGATDIPAMTGNQPTTSANCVVGTLGTSNNGDTTNFKAIWTANMYEITLDKNDTHHGLTDGSPTTLYTRYDDNVYLSAADRTANQNAMSTSANGLTSTPTGNTYTLTLTQNLPGSHQSNEVTAANNGTVVAASSATMGFTGFYSQATGGVKYIEQNGKINQDGIDAGTTSTGGTWYAQYACSNATTYTPQLTGYTFDGWYDNANAGSQVSNFCLTQDTEVFAHWTPKTTTVAYDCGAANNTSGTWQRPSGWTVDTQTATYDAAFSHPDGSTACTLSGYTFDRWNCVEGTTASATDTPLVGNGIVSGKWHEEVANVICTAVWSGGQINLTYDADCAAGTSCASWTNNAANKCTYDTVFTLPTAPTKTGYTFGGWTVESVTPAQQ